MIRVTDSLRMTTGHMNIVAASPPGKPIDKKTLAEKGAAK